MRSLQARLSAGLVVALVGLVGIILIVGSYSVRQLAEEFVASRLEHDIDVLLMAIHFDGTGRVVIDRSRLSPVFQQPYSGHYYKVETATAALRSRSLWDADLAMPDVNARTVSRSYVYGPQHKQLLVLARAFHLRGRDLSILVAEDLSYLAAGLRRLTIAFLIIALISLAGLILAQRVIVRRGLRPLEEARQDIQRLERGEINQLSLEVPSEVRPLAEEINRLLGVMEQRLQRSRHALGNLAHALKSPLTMLTQLVEGRELLLEDLRPELGQLTGQIRSLVDRELKRARIAGAAMPGQRIVLAEELRDLIETMQKIYHEKPVSLEYRIPPGCQFPGDRDDLLELFGNLLDNAWQWAASRIRLSVNEAADWLIFVIEDDGPGRTEQELASLTRRGVRVDESRSGHGLGLAIVSDIVEQYRGVLRLGRSPELGGFLAEIRLPSRELTFS